MRKRPYILPPTERYCIPGPNEIMCISENQTLSVVLGSCISTVFLAKKKKYFLAANHIVIAKPHKNSIIATKSARNQIDEILSIFDTLKINHNEIICLYLIGAGSKKKEYDFTVPHLNVLECEKILNSYRIPILFHDTGSHFFATFSLSKEYLSIVIENKFTDSHISFTIDLNNLKTNKINKRLIQPVSPLEQENDEFEKMISDEIITFITGEKNRFSS